MNSPELPGYASCRTTFQRMSDRRFFHGWVDRMTARAIRLRLTEDPGLASGSEYVFQVFGLREMATFRARQEGPVLLGDGAYLVQFTLTESIQFSPAVERPRRAVDFKPAVLVSDCEEDVYIADVSAEGLGLITPRALPRDQRVTVRADVDGRIAEVAGVVRYSAKSRVCEGMFKTGLAVEHVSRIDQALWSSLVAA